MLIKNLSYRNKLLADKIILVHLKLEKKLVLLCGKAINGFLYCTLIFNSHFNLKLVGVFVIGFLLKKKASTRVCKGGVNINTKKE